MSPFDFILYERSAYFIRTEIYTLLIAGHETTSTTLTWLLYDLAQPENQGAQTKLREELQSVSTDRPTMEALNALPYLDAVVRETLRLNSALDMTPRSAGQDTSIPVSTPYVDKNGVERMEIRYTIVQTWSNRF